jgi:tetratricopeptide (TPR) repeat protein
MAARARMLAGQIERGRDRLRLAEREFCAATRLDPSLVQAHRELIYIYGMQLRRPDVNREFQALQRLTRLTFDDVYRWSSLLNNYWEPVDVIEDLIKFVSADPQDRWSRLALAGILRRMGLHEQAETTLAVFPAEDPGANAIRIQIALDRRDDATADKLLALGGSDQPELERLRGDRALARGDARAAVRHYRNAAAAAPSDHETVFGLWPALALLGDDKETKPSRDAARNLDRLNTLLQRGRLEKAPENGELMRELGVACAALEREDEARAWLELAIARNPLDSEAQQAMFRLSAVPRRRSGEKPAIPRKDRLLH